MANQFVATDLQQGQERQHRTLLANAINELAKVRPPHDRTDAEVGAGSTPLDTSYAPGAFKRAGAYGDGVTEDTDSLDRAFNSGEAQISAQPGTYISGSVTASAAVKKLIGQGTLQQKALHSDLLTFDGNTDLEINGLNFLGAAGAAEDLALSGNTGLTIKGARRVIVANCKFERWLFYGLYFEDCHEIIVGNNVFYQCASPLRFRGCSRVAVVSNVFDETCLDPTNTPDNFTVALGLDSTDGHAFGICKEFVVANNTFTDIGNAQGVLVHAGDQVAVTGNTFKNTAIPVSVNPYKATDPCTRINIVANNIEGATSGSYSNADIGINVQGGGLDPDGNPIPDPEEILIASNIINSANRVMQSASFGAIRVGFTKKCVITANVITTCYGTAIICTDSEEQVVITSNVINDIVAAGGVQRGIDIQSANTKAYIAANHIADIAGVNGIGIRVAGAGQVQIHENLYRNVTRNVSGASNSQWGNTLSVTAGATVDLGGVETVLFEHAAPTTVTTFTNVQPYKRYTFHFANSNTTIDRTNAFLDGGTNKNPNADDVMEVLGWTSDDIKQRAPVSVNA